jgi:methanethiol S-methyltransferase
MLINFILIVLAMAVYGLVHSLLASLQVKDWVEEKFGISARRWYRFFYNVFAVLSFLPVSALVAFLPDVPLYKISLPWNIFTLALQGAAGLGLLFSVMGTGAFSFLGLRQLFSAPVDGQHILVTNGLYRYVRHPIYFCGLIFLWLTPVMTWNILAFNLAASAYFFIGAIYEEKKLILEFGDAYLEYRQNTPMIFPRFPHKN